MSSLSGKRNSFCEEDILAEEFPDDVSISALCDCGRHKRMHTHAHYKAPERRQDVPQSDYQATFQARTSPRPRSSKRPPPTPRNPHPAPMTFQTNQRTEFRNLGHVERVKPIVHEDVYEPPQVPLETRTYYSQEFTPKQPLPMVPTGLAKQQDVARVQPLDPLDSRTTTKEAYKAWAPQPSLAFGELPSFTGSILFPERKPLPESTMRHSYQGKFLPPVAPAKMAAPSIKLEGERAFDTTHNDTYRAVKGDHRPRPVAPKEASSPVGRRGKFDSVTQSKRDFPGYEGRQPLPPKPAEPAPTTIDLKFDEKRSFSTENRTTFRGHNVVDHPAPKSCKATDEEFSRPTVKFETETCQKRDFKPIDISSAAVPKSIAPHNTVHHQQREGSFDGRTMNNEFYKNWGAQPRMRYGDFHENRPYLPPQQPFKGESITRTSFVPQPLQPVVLHKMPEQPYVKDSGGKMELTTSYRHDYPKKKPRMCRAQVFILQQQLKQRNEEKEAVVQKSISVK